MAYDNVAKVLQLARALAATAEGLTLDEMAEITGSNRRTVERMRDLVRDVFPQLEEIADPPTKRFRIPSGFDAFARDPTSEELSDLSLVIREYRTAGADARAASLAELERKIRASMRPKRRQLSEVDVEALVRAELIAVQAGPRAVEDPEIFGTLREALLSLRMLRFNYQGGSAPGDERDVIPYGIIFGRMNYLIGADPGTTKPKHFRLDKVENLRCLDAPASPPAGFKLREFANTSFGYFEGQPEDVVLEILPHGMEDFTNYSFHPTQRIDVLPSGGVKVSFRASGMLELAWHLFSWGDKLEIVEPASLRDLMIRELQSSLEHHQARLGISKPGRVS